MKEEYNRMATYMLIRFRKALKLSQQQLADRLGVNRTAVSKWENDEQFIPGWVIVYLYACQTETQPKEAP